MKDEKKTKEQFISELIEMRRRVAELEALEAEHKRADEVLAESESRLLSILASMDDLVFVFDGQSRFTRCYSAIGELYMPPEEFLGKKHSEVMSPYVDRLFAEAFNKAKKGEVTEYEYQLEIGDETKWYSAKLSPMFLDNEFAGSVAVARNITERKQAEEALRETRDYLENLFNYANAPIIVWDPEFRITRFNHAFERLAGYTADEVIGQELYILFPEASRDESLSKIARALSGEYWESVEIPILRKDGETRLALWNSANIYAGDGLTLVATIAQGVDITERKRAEEALRQRTVQLQARNEELDAFAHTVAHDLKHPLTLITGFASVLEGSYTTMPDDERQKQLHTIVRTGRKMNSIIDELLLLAGVRKMEVEMRPLRVASIASEARQRLAYMIEEHQAEIILPETWPMAMGYGPWVEEVLVNYLSNAIKYGGRPPRVEMGATVQAGGRVRFWIRDNGPGLAPEEQARLFTPFTQLNQVRAKGHGLGLSIVRRIVEKMGGQVSVESEVGGGSVFAFTLPGMASPR